MIAINFDHQRVANYNNQGDDYINRYYKTPSNSNRDNGSIQGNRNQDALLLLAMEEHLQLLRDTAQVMTIGELNARKDKATSYYGDFKEAHKDVLQGCQRPADVTASLETCNSATTLHLKVLAAIEAATETQLAERPILPSINEIRLQKLNGNLTDWVEWRTNFEEKVLKTRLSCAQKIDLLLDSVIGDAK